MSNRRVAQITALFCTLMAAGAACAQFSFVPTPLPAERRISDAQTDFEYRKDAARHVYAALPTRIFKGRLPPLLYGIAITEIDLDAEGNVLDVRLVREPAAAEVGPWIGALIRRVAPFPPAPKVGRLTVTEIWLVHRSGNFQLDSLTEGQD
jgi:periplasmic protein TonB